MAMKSAAVQLALGQRDTFSMTDFSQNASLLSTNTLGSPLSDFSDLESPLEIVPEPKKQGLFRRYLCFILCIVAIVVIIVLLGLSTLAYNNYAAREGAGKQNVKNVIFMISDGMGIASVNIARSFYQAKYGKPDTFTLPLDGILTGSVRTRSSSSLITDSAAGATAYSCGVKSYNGAIGVNSSGDACGTVLEAAHARNYRTGLITTSEITDATPAAFSAHVSLRANQSEIALQQLFGYADVGRTVDLMFGGGSCFFLPQNSSGCREDNRDLLQEVASSWTVATNRTSFDLLASNSSLPIISVLNPKYMNYEIDRNVTQEPSLAEMTLKALNIFDFSIISQNATGFFLMVEGGKIDLAGHLNDPVTNIHDTIAYNDAVSIAMAYVDTHPGTVLISVSDHETGGLAVGRQLTPDYPVYEWHPETMYNITNSMEIIGISLAQTLSEITANSTSSPEDLAAQLKAAVVDAFEEKCHVSPQNYTEIDIQSVLDAALDPRKVTYVLDDLISRNAMLGWSTHGHTGVDVGLFVYGLAKEDATSEIPLFPLSEKTFVRDTAAMRLHDFSWWMQQAGSELKSWAGSSPTRAKYALEHGLENTDLSAWVSRYLGLNLQTITDRLAPVQPE